MDLTMQIVPEDAGQPRRRGVPPPSVAPPPPRPVAKAERMAATLVQLLDRISYLRFNARTAKADRGTCLAFLQDAIEQYRVDADGRRGLLSEEDPFSFTFSESVGLLHREFAELTMPRNPYPAHLPTGESPFAQGRFYSGKFFGGKEVHAKQ